MSAPTMSVASPAARPWLQLAIIWALLLTTPHMARVGFGSHCILLFTRECTFSRTRVGKHRYMPRCLHPYSRAEGSSSAFRAR